MNKTITLLLASVVNSHAANEFWLTPDAFTPAVSNGLTYDSRQAFPIGSEQNPYNGCSDASRFEATTSLLPPNSLIHLAPGVFHVAGGWNPKQGQHIVGAGKYLTIIQNDARVVKSWSGLGTAHWMLQPASPYAAHNIELESLTLDANYQTNTFLTLNGAALWGGGNSMRHVRLINCASYTHNATNYSECFGFIITSGAVYDFDESGDNTMEDCEVSNYHQNFNNNMTPMAFGGAAHGSILNNLLVNTMPDGTNDMLGFGISANDTLVQGNYVIKNHDALHFDVGSGWTNLTVIGNFFDVAWVQDFHNARFAGIKYIGNTVTLDAFSQHPSYIGFINMQGEAAIQGIYSSGNRISIVPTTNSAPAYFAVMQNVTGFLSQGDFIDDGCSNQIVISTNIVIQSKDLNGAVYKFNQSAQ